jgi:LPS sulfotransferase NodH
MLEGIDSGYEAKFDFPFREGPPEHPYLVASVPRSGSTFFSHLLWKTGCLGAPLEYLNFEPAGPYGSAHESAAEQDALWSAALQRRTSPNGVFGLKAFPLQLEDVHRLNPRLMGEVIRFLVGNRAQSKVVRLCRRDRTGHAISYARAILSGIWRKEQEGDARPEPEYSAPALARAEGLIEQQERAWDQMCRDLGIVPLVVWLEDALADEEGAAKQVARHLEVEIDPAAALDIPQIQRQSQDGARAWAEAHSKS